MILTITDENFSGQVLNKVLLELQQESLTVKDLIVKRVTHEVQQFNSRSEAVYNGLVQPEAAEVTLNNYQHKLKKHKQIDAEAQCYRALEAFTKNGFFVIVNDRQAESLEEEILVASFTKVSFIKIMSLVGG
ncbi:hypothetical protein [Rhodocytophaga rosea]|nr:hypothetical protein [Rhodocytophaga rosea]